MLHEVPVSVDRGTAQGAAPSLVCFILWFVLTLVPTNQNCIFFPPLLPSDATVKQHLFSSFSPPDTSLYCLGFGAKSSLNKPVFTQYNLLCPFLATCCPHPTRTDPFLSYLVL